MTSRRSGLWLACGVAGVSMAVFVIVFIFVGTIAIGILDTGERPQLSITAVFATVMVLGLVPFVLFARSCEGYAPAIASITALGWLPVLAASGDYELGRAIIDGPDGSGSYLGVFAVATAVCPIGFAIAAPFAAGLVRSGNALRVIAPAVWLIGAVIVAIATMRCTRLPDPDTYAAALPTHSTIEVHEETVIGTTSVRFADPSIDYNHCFFEERATPHHITTDSLPCARIDLTSDAANALWILRPHSRFKGDRVGAALRVGSLEQISVFPRTIPKSVAPPIGWVVGAAGGLLFSLVPLIAAIIFRRRADALRAAGANLGAIAVTALSCATLLAAAAHFLIR